MWLFWPLKLCLRNSAGTGCIAPKLHGAQVEGSKTPRAKNKGKFASMSLGPLSLCPPSFGTLNLCPAEFSTPQPVPCGVLERCNMFWRHNLRSQNNQENYLFKGYFCKPLTFQRSIPQTEGGSAWVKALKSPNSIFDVTNAKLLIYRLA